MSLLRPTIARQLLRPAAPAAVRHFTPAVARWDSKVNAPPANDVAPKPVQPKVESAVASPDATSTGVSTNVRYNQPDWTAHTDHATGEYSPVPKRVMDGSEEGTVLPAAVLSGAPVDLQARTVRIYKPVKPATQSGDWHSHHWLMDWDVLGKGHRWENELMGWQSSADAMQGTNLKFKTKEDAIAFAEKQGYEYFVQEPNVRHFRPKQYAMNFLHSPKKLKHIRTK